MDYMAAAAVMITSGSLALGMAGGLLAAVMYAMTRTAVAQTGVARSTTPLPVRARRDARP